MLKKLLVFISICIVMMGCSLDNQGKSREAEIGFDCRLTSLVTQTGDAESMEAQSRCILNLTGNLLVTNLDTGVETNYTWYGTLNYETFEITSNKTIVMKPGTYDFILTLTISDYQYAGSACGIIICEGMNVIPMTIYSIIGDVTSDFDLTQISSLRFVYPQDEFDNIDRPKMGVLIDDRREILLSFDKSTGITQTYINLLPGEYHIQLKLYDGNVQVGKSIKEQENVTIEIKQNIVMDLIPIYGETTFTLSHEGGTARFNFLFPGEVVDEVDGVENLLIDFRLYSTINGYKQDYISLIETAEGYTGSISFDKFHYDTVAIAITFIDLRDFEVIGACGEDNIKLTSNSRKITLKMELLRRAIVSGNILAVLGINVINTQNIPENGALVYINDEFKGITGSVQGGTKGYLRVYQKKGECQVKAIKSEKAGTMTIEVNPLDVINIEIMLDDTI